MRKPYFFFRTARLRSAPARKAGTRQETTDGSSCQAPSVTQAGILAVCQRPGAAHGRPAGAHRSYLPDQCRFAGTLSAGTKLCTDGQAAASAATGRLACPGSPEFLGGTAGICFRHQARLRCRQSGVVSSVEPRTGRGTDYAPKIPEKAVY